MPGLYITYTDDPLNDSDCSRMQVTSENTMAKFNFTHTSIGIRTKHENPISETEIDKVLYDLLIAKKFNDYGVIEITTENALQLESNFAKNVMISHLGETGYGLIAMNDITVGTEVLYTGDIIFTILSNSSSSFKIGDVVPGLSCFYCHNPYLLEVFSNLTFSDVMPNTDGNNTLKNIFKKEETTRKIPRSRAANCVIDAKNSGSLMRFAQHLPTEEDVVTWAKGLIATINTEEDLIEVIKQLIATTNTEEVIIKMVKGLIIMANTCEVNIVQVIKDLTISINTEKDLVETIKQLIDASESTEDLKIIDRLNIVAIANMERFKIVLTCVRSEEKLLPNLTPAFMFRTTRPIKKGDILGYSYCDNDVIARESYFLPLGINRVLYTREGNVFSPIKRQQNQAVLFSFNAISMLQFNELQSETEAATLPRMVY